jgi:hypothetical protein
MSVVDGSMGAPMSLEERASMPLAGGLLQNGYQCGLLWGAALTAGAQAYRRSGSSPQAESQAILTTQRLVEAFLTRKKSINCRQITGIEWKQPSQRRLQWQLFMYFIKGGAAGCFRLAARYAQLAFDEVNAAYPEKHIELPDHPVSCAAMLARKMGASDLHAVMAAGLAGGIGVSGGACGALGTAVWIIAMKSGLQSYQDFVNTPPQIQKVLDAFIKSSGSEFECSKIVGRKFENVADHAAYLRAGGCSEILGSLAV